MSDYWTLPGLQDVYLEDSWVRRITVEPNLLRVELEVVLRESHTLYEPPPPGSQYCYRSGTLLFATAREVEWQMGGSPASDASGEIDFGTLDVLQVDDGKYTLSGDFGEVRVVSAPPTLTLDA